MSDQPLHLVVLAAGEGKRMNSDLPKVLQPVADRPMLEHLVRTAATLSPACIHVVVGHQAERVREALAGIVEVPLNTPEQHQRLGTGHAVQQALGDIPDDARVVVLPGLNHFFQTAETGAPDEYPRLEETLAPAALDLIGDWIRTHTGPRRMGSCTVHGLTSPRRPTCEPPALSPSPTSEAMQPTWRPGGLRG